MLPEVIAAKLFDLAIVYLQVKASEGVRVDELGAEIQAAHDQGRDADVARFRAKADAAQARVHEHLGMTSKPTEQTP